jgi:muconolactone delta-isomerase
MLFYVKGELREQESLPPERWLGMVASTWQAIKQLENNGKVLAGGAMIGQRAGCVIVDVTSNEELFELLTRLPVAGYMTWEVVPLIPADTALETAKWRSSSFRCQGRVRQLLRRSANPVETTRCLDVRAIHPDGFFVGDLCPTNSAARSSANPNANSTSARSASGISIVRSLEPAIRQPSQSSFVMHNLYL